MQTEDNFPVLETKRLRLSRLVMPDAAELFRYRSLPEVVRFQSWAPRSAQDAATFVAAARAVAFNQAGAWFQFGLRLKSDGKLVGDLGLQVLERDDRQAELGITVAPEMQNQGLGGEALGVIVGYLFGSLGKHRLTASIDPENHASRRLLEKSGFCQEAHFRQSLWINGGWADDVVFAVLQSDWISSAGKSKGT